MAQRKNICPDCGTKVQTIKLVDATELGFGREGTTHVELGYAAADATPSFFMGKIKQLGRVKGQICPDCGRILLYGSGKGST